MPACQTSMLLSKTMFLRRAALLGIVMVDLLYPPTARAGTSPSSTPGAGPEFYMALSPTGAGCTDDRLTVQHRVVAELRAVPD